MNCPPFSIQYLRLGEALPFPLRDVGGRLLLAVNMRMDDPKTFAGLQAADWFADDHASNVWRRWLGSALDTAMRQNVTLQEFADTRAPAGSERGAGPAKSLAEQRDDLASGAGRHAARSACRHALDEPADGRARARDAPGRAAARRLALPIDLHRR